ncbi:hypothetical protein [Actinopolymorpha pittospori]|uniref:Uncharacterized protein n=1 Tax=Actinopolymorpha pittospori TaxID=648752 RepID=A0A927RAK0_9ACTN|nr:hypothetical protein [Actinopolymorpha pittospori]MBE1607714.1 hypothetical protein [Actinopolymorpha pittospori]
MAAEGLHADEQDREQLIESARIALKSAGYRAFPRVGMGGKQYAIEIPYPSLPELSVILRCDRWDGRWVFRQTGCRPVADADDLETLIGWVKDLVEPPFGPRT